MSRKPMFFFDAKAERELGYRTRPASQALFDAVAWFPHVAKETRGAVS